MAGSTTRILPAVDYINVTRLRRRTRRSIHDLPADLTAGEVLGMDVDVKLSTNQRRLQRRREARVSDQLTGRAARRARTDRDRNYDRARRAGRRLMEMRRRNGG